MDAIGGAGPAAEVRVLFLIQGGVFEIGTLAEPLLKMFAGIVRGNEKLEEGEATRFAKGKRTQQQSVDYGEDSGVGTDADGESEHGEDNVPGVAAPKAEGIGEILECISKQLEGQSEFSSMSFGRPAIRTTRGFQFGLPDGSSYTPITLRRALNCCDGAHINTGEVKC